MEPWYEKAGPLMVLAPMADVTDSAFRLMVARHGKPDALWTEFVSADGLYHTREVARMADDVNPLMRLLRYDVSERPIIAQIFTGVPAMAEYASALVRTLGFDGVDINMGCPDRSVEKQGAGAALMKDYPRARSIIAAAKRGAGELPVSIKTRIGYAKNELASWLPELLAEKPAAVTIHARTRKELSLVPARWEHVHEAVVLRDRLGSSARILGNGDVASIGEARARAYETGADGVMLGRAIFGNPWLFSANPEARAPQERIQALIEHLELWEEHMAHKPFAVMKKHFKAYLHGWSGARELRARVMEASSPQEARAILHTCSVS